MSIANLAYKRADLFNAAITTAVSATASTAIEGLVGCQSLAIHFNFDYGSGGTSFKFWVQTSLDGGTTWVDIACFAGTTSDMRRVVNLSTRTPVTTAATPSDGALADNTAVDGILGDRFRVKRTTVGTYAGTTCQISIVSRG